MIYDRSNPLIQGFPVVLVLDVNDSFELEYCNPDMQIPSLCLFVSFFLEYILPKKKKEKKERESGNNNTLIMYIYISALR